jgi:DNA polymerase III epsilon subunit-like protein
MRIVVFDTETTGLPQDRRAPPSETDKWPYIVQISHIVYDVDTQTIADAADHLVALPDGVDLPEASSKVHGITQSQLRRKGVPARVAIAEFAGALEAADWVAAHNLAFDRQVVRAECCRQGVADPFIRVGAGLRECCTMMQGRALCALWAARADGSRYIKYPSLDELHTELFAERAGSLHDALADVLVCLRCYLRMVHDADLMECARARRLYELYGIGSTRRRKLTPPVGNQVE